MQEKVFTLLNGGMRRDDSISKADKTTAFENINIRVTASDSGTQFSVTNERGTKAALLAAGSDTITGSLLGWTVLNKTVVLFTADQNNGYIYKAVYDDVNSFAVTKLFDANGLFLPGNRIEAVAYYEREDIQKVYWVDGVNPLRSINIAADPSTFKRETLDSTGWITTNVTGTVTKEFGGGSTRQNGTIQYFVTFYNKYGNETGIAWASDIIYLSPERGGSADGTNHNTITISLTNLDGRLYTNYRVYSIFRGTLNGTPVASIVSEGRMSSRTVSGSTIYYTTVVDDGTHLTAEDTSRILYLGSAASIPNTLTHKDGTLFIGNLSSVGENINAAIDTILENEIDRSADGITSDIEFYYDDVENTTQVGFYPYRTQIDKSSSDILSFKGGEKYRFAVRFRTVGGFYTKAFWIGDAVNTLYPKVNEDGTISRIVAKWHVPAGVAAELQELGTLVASNPSYKIEQAQLMIAEATYADRSIKAQGFVNPTVFNAWERYNNRVYASPSWISRPRLSEVANRHLETIHKSTESTGEIECNYWENNQFHNPFYYIDNGEIDGLVTTDYDALMIIVSVLVTTGAVVANVYSVKGTVTDQNNSDALNNLKSHVFTHYNSLQNKEKGYRIDWKDIQVKVADSRYETESEKKDAFYAGILEAVKSMGFNGSNYISSQLITDRWYNAVTSNPVYPMVFSLKSVSEDFDTPLKALNYSDPTSHDREWLSLTNVPAGKTDNYFTAYNTKHLTFVDENIVTLDSPELAYEAVSVDKSGYKFRIVGAAFMSSNISDYTIDAYPGVLKDNNVVNADFSSTTGGKVGLLSWPLWKDFGLSEKSGTGGIDIHLRTPENYNIDGDAYYWVHMWQGSGSITGFTESDYQESNDVVVDAQYTANIKSKTFANMQFAYATRYAQNYVQTGTSRFKPWRTSWCDIRQFNQTSESLLELSLNAHGDKIYYDGNVKSVLTMPDNIKYPKAYSSKLPSDGVSTEADGEWLFSNMPVTISYSSNTHAVIALGEDMASLLGEPERIAYTLPSVYNADGEWSSPLNTPINNVGPYISWGDGLYEMSPGTETISGQTYPYIWGGMNTFMLDAPYLFIGEIYKDFSEQGVIDTRYGGATEEAVLNNRFLPAGPLTKLVTTQEGADVIANQGDTYFQRWDCLRTKPYADSDENKVINITSVMLETHINLDGGEHKYRGIKKLASIDPSLYDKLNPAYSQKNNFFTSRDIDTGADSYKSTITWTKQKNDAEEIDNWTHITLANTLNLDGDKGECNALRRFANNIYAFQDKGISEIMYNSRVQISTNDNVPVELANSGKVDGKKYVTDKYGCSNKWSIVEGKLGLYFVDDINKAFCNFNGNTITDLSVEKGFKAWFKGNHYRVVDGFYDKQTSEVYLSGSFANNTLAYNEDLGAFSSFYNYSSLGFITNVAGRSVSFCTSNNSFWFNREGLFTKIFGTQVGYSIKYRISPEPINDKIWSHLEYRGDAYRILTSDGDIMSGMEEGRTGVYNDLYTIHQETETFDSFEVSNEYQYNAFDSTDTNPVKKFRIWRFTLPRADANVAGGTNIYGLDRFRNPWVAIKMSKTVTGETEKDLMQLHDVTIHYFD